MKPRHFIINDSVKKTVCGLPLDKDVDSVGFWNSDKGITCPDCVNIIRECKVVDSKNLNSINTIDQYVIRPYECEGYACKTRCPAFNNEDDGTMVGSAYCRVCGYRIKVDKPNGVVYCANIVDGDEVIKVENKKVENDRI